MSAERLGFRWDALMLVERGRVPPNAEPSGGSEDHCQRSPAGSQPQPGCYAGCQPEEAPTQVANRRVSAAERFGRT